MRNGSQTLRHISVSSLTCDVQKRHKSYYAFLLDHGILVKVTHISLSVDGCVILTQNVMNDVHMLHNLEERTQNQRILNFRLH